MTMLDQWPYAKQMPSAVVKYWGSPPRAQRRLRPIITETCGDGHPPDGWRPCFLPRDADQTAPGSLEERNLMARAIVLRHSVIMRGRPSTSDRCQLHGYERMTGEVSGGYLLPDLSPAGRDDLREPWVPSWPSVAQSITPQNPFLRSCVNIGVSAGLADAEVVYDRIQSEAPKASPLDQVAGLILALIVGNLQIVDFYRAWGGALNSVYPFLKELGDVAPLMSVLDGSALHLKQATSDSDVIGGLGDILRQINTLGWQEKRS